MYIRTKTRVCEDAALASWYPAQTHTHRTPNPQSPLETFGDRSQIVSHLFSSLPFLTNADRMFSPSHILLMSGASSCGLRPNAVFKCPDGYPGGYPDRLMRQGGYDDFECEGNPFSNKIGELVCSCHRTSDPRCLLVFASLDQSGAGSLTRSHLCHFATSPTFNPYRSLLPSGFAAIPLRSQWQHPFTVVVPPVLQC